jgi:carbonic anhydrase
MPDRPGIRELFEKNTAWAARVSERDPQFFLKLSRQQSPRYLWIGCADSRVPANEIVDLMPGEMFVHRNLANLVIHTDLNCLSVLQFAVDVLKVRHVIVCGHYGCSGVRAALRGDRVGLSDNGLRHILDVRDRHKPAMACAAGEAAEDRLCELNVIEQAANVCRTGIVQDAWDRGQPLSVHGWIYNLCDGLIKDLGLNVGSGETLHPNSAAAVARLRDGT